MNHDFAVPGDPGAWSGRLTEGHHPFTGRTTWSDGTEEELSVTHDGVDAGPGPADQTGHGAGYVGGAGCGRRHRQDCVTVPGDDGTGPRRLCCDDRPVIVRTPRATRTEVETVVAHRSVDGESRTTDEIWHVHGRVASRARRNGCDQYQ